VGEADSVEGALAVPQGVGAEVELAIVARVRGGFVSANERPLFGHGLADAVKDIPARLIRHRRWQVDADAVVHRLHRLQHCRRQLGTDLLRRPTGGAEERHLPLGSDPLEHGHQCHGFLERQLDRRHEEAALDAVAVGFGIEGARDAGGVERVEVAVDGPLVDFTQASQVAGVEPPPGLDRADEA
jgi:hypothetical protein